MCKKDDKKDYIVKGKKVRKGKKKMAKLAYIYNHTNEDTWRLVTKMLNLLTTHSSHLGASPASEGGLPPPASTTAASEAPPRPTSS